MKFIFGKQVWSMYVMLAACLIKGQNFAGFILNVYGHHNNYVYRNVSTQQKELEFDFWIGWMFILFVSVEFPQVP